MPRPRDTLSFNEGEARFILIDPALRSAGWGLDDRTQVGFEVPVDGYDAEPWNGVTDYVLHDPSGNVLAVVEAKRGSRHPREADEQLRHYVTEIAKKQAYAPFGFMTNGRQVWFWEVGQANPRVIAGFFSPQDLRRLLFLRLNARPLQAVAINTSIVERP
jgi:type I site-specific restriction endonuclease